MRLLYVTSDSLPARIIRGIDGGEVDVPLPAESAALSRAVDQLGKPYAIAWPAGYGES